MAGDRGRIEGMGLPVVPGATFRHIRGREGSGPMAAVITRSREADSVELATTVEDLAAGFEHPTDLDPASGVLVAEAGGRIIGTARIWQDRRAERPHSSLAPTSWSPLSRRETLVFLNVNSELRLQSSLLLRRVRPLRRPGQRRPAARRSLPR